MLLLLQFFVFTSLLCFVLSQQHDLRTNQWIAWDLATKKHNSAYSSQIQSIVSLLSQEDKNLFANQIARIDIINSTNHITNKQKHVYNWAWSSGGCAGIKDSWLVKSNGLKMFKNIEREYIQLKKYNIISETGVSIDIGAHVGDSTLPFALQSAMTIAFDPSISVYPLLQVNAKINPQLNIHTFPYGIAKEDGEYCMHIY